MSMRPLAFPDGLIVSWLRFSVCSSWPHRGGRGSVASLLVIARVENAIRRDVAVNTFQSRCDNNIGAGEKAAYPVVAGDGGE